MYTTYFYILYLLITWLCLSIVTCEAYTYKCKNASICILIQPSFICHIAISSLGIIYRSLCVIYLYCETFHIYIVKISSKWPANKQFKKLN